MGFVVLSITRLLAKFGESPLDTSLEGTVVLRVDPDAFPKHMLNNPSVGLLDLLEELGGTASHLEAFLDHLLHEPDVAIPDCLLEKPLRHLGNLFPAARFY